MKNKFHALTFKTKMFITFGSAFFLMVTIVGLVSFLFYVHDMRKQTNSLSNELSTQFSQTIDLYFEDVNRLSLSIFADSYIQNMLWNYSYDNEMNDVEAKANLYPIIFNQVYPNSQVEGVTLYSASGSKFEYRKSRGLVISHNQKREEWMDELNEQANNDFILLPTHDEMLSNKEPEPVVSLVRNIYQIPRGQQIGFIKIDIHTAVFDKLLQIEDVDIMDEYRNVFIIDSDNKVVLDDKGEREGTIIDIDIPDESNDLLLEWKNHFYLFANNISSFTKWNTVILIDNAVMVSERNRVLVVIAIAGIIVMFIIAIISYSLSHNISRPLILLRERMERVEKGDLTDRMELTNNQELDVLIRVYNNMLDSINKLIVEVYESSIAEKNAKISALQSQINPHFLYNTLNVMKSASRVKGVEEVAVIAEALADLFKYTTKDLEAKVPLENELGHINNYIKIQQYRFAGRFKNVVVLDKEAKHALIPKLLVQPIVENAIIHGLEYRRKDGVINIHVLRNGNLLIIKVKDNGTGISPANLAGLKKSIQNSILNPQGKGVGLVNVVQRIKLLYGYQYGIEFESNHLGTIVTLTLPFETNDKL
ncbi:sensor histidine kinase [Gracilibacillus phocaeensis]|uniref:sensor histidine kinase n=1 Tax=Gracilibacillus phocaeensis TaxID=2042304 RepID=UPI001030A1D1|nr:sensor histidine kinase [Gracilibacillus phocaeensis]